MLTVWKLGCSFLALGFALFLMTLSTYGQENRDVCRVTTSIWSIEGGIGTGISEVGKFPVDDFENGAKNVFSYKFDDSSFSIVVGVEYGDFPAVEKGRPNMINLSLLVNPSNIQNKVENFSAVEAGTVYKHKWGTIYVRKDVVEGDRVFTFTLTCSDGLSKSGLQRGQPSWVKRSGRERDMLGFIYGNNQSPRKETRADSVVISY